MHGRLHAMSVMVMRKACLGRQQDREAHLLAVRDGALAEG